MRIAVVGAGLAGATSAALLRDIGHHVEVFECREHLGGNCYDEWDRGVLVHRYGPHGFHTSNERVWKFLNRFTRFHPVALRVEGRTRLGIIPLPFNDVAADIAGDLSPEEIRELVFRDYSEKHWGIPWTQIPKSITSRLPERRRTADCRYHLDRWQGVPVRGYTAMFEAMLDGLPCHLGCHPDAWRKYRWDHVVFTGSIDDYFGEGYGRLEYRSLDFRYETEMKRAHFQLNECNRMHPWTRSVDHSHWLGQEVAETVIGYEYSREWQPGLVRMYPKPFGGNVERYKCYRAMADKERDVSFVGRLATYKYIDMDDTVAQVMRTTESRWSGTIPGCRLIKE